MRRLVLLLIPLLAACDGGEREQPVGREQAVATDSAEPAPVARRIEHLPGLYEGAGDGDRRARMCIGAGSAEGATFGLVTEVPGSCAGAGDALLEGGRLRLTMGGDESCVIEARIEGALVRFPPTVPSGCAYYCAPGATLAGAVFEKTGGTADDAMRALDLAGDPLCG